MTTRNRFPPVLAGLIVLIGCGVPTDRPRTTPMGRLQLPTIISQQLSAKGQAALVGFIDGAGLPDLRRPRFQEYSPAARMFYGSLGNRLAWIRSGQPTRQALEMIDLLRNVEKKGLDPEDYDASRWAKRVATLQESPSELDFIRFDLALTVAAMRYGSDLHTGRMDRREVNFSCRFNRLKTGWADFLRNFVIDAANVDKVFGQLEPSFAEYARTQRALLRYQKLASESPSEPLPETKGQLRPGDFYSGVVQLARLLRILGDLAPDAVIASDRLIYEGPLVDAVKHFQERHGLSPDGRIDNETLRELNRPLSYRVRQLELALERWRWLQFEFSRPAIVINIPEFRLRAYDVADRPALTMKVVVGKAARHKTPELVQNMKHVIFRPYWNVPPSIQRAELVPAIARNPGYMAQHAYELVDTRTRQAVSPGTDDLLHRLRSGTLAIRQRPGGHNSLGLVKFVFPNEYDVYLHGTPATQLFARSRRDLSHGCIRLENAEELAAWVLRSNTGWDEDTIHAAMTGNRTVSVKVTKPLPVLVIYMTAVATEDGEVHFYQDVYGRDATLQRALEARRHISR